MVPHVTRLWIAPGYSRIAAAFGDKGWNSYVAACWEDTTREPVWYADLFGQEDCFPDPAFSPDLSRVVFVLEECQGDMRFETFLVTATIGTTAPPQQLGNDSNASNPYFPIFSADGKHLYTLVTNFQARRREIAQWETAWFDHTSDSHAKTRMPDMSPVSVGTIRVSSRVDDCPSCLIVSPDAHFLAWGAYNGAVRVSNLKSHRTVMVIQPWKQPRISAQRVSMAFARDGSRIGVVQFRHGRQGWRGDAAVCDVARGAEERQVRASASVNAIALTADGGRLYTACADGSVGVWDVPKLKKITEYKWNIGEVFCVTVAPDGLTSAAGGENGQIVIWDVDS
jgi:WD40 repeat protein